jgi:hypothetical protein
MNSMHAVSHCLLLALNAAASRTEPFMDDARGPTEDPDFPINGSVIVVDVTAVPWERVNITSLTSVVYDECLLALGI